MTPAPYQWLDALPGLPNTIRLGLREMGVKEFAGDGSNPVILGWRDELNQAGVKISGYSDDDIPWCGLFVAIIVFRRLGNRSEVVKDPLWARNWTRYGYASTSAPSLGDVLVFQRGSGGHVGFYVAEDKTAYHVLGGNQSNRVSIARIDRGRLLTARRPPYRTQPQSGRPFYVAPSGSMSTNEA